MTDLSIKNFRCREIWGGNRRVEEAVDFGRLRGYLLSIPYDSAEGGDIHFLSFCDQDSLSKIVIADVAGHGDHVSKIAAGLRSLLRENIDELDNTKLLVSINDTLRNKLHDGKFVTMVAATFNGDDGAFIYAYAGHPTVLLYDRVTSKWQFLGSIEERDSGVPLGIVGDTDYIQKKMYLKKGDMLLFYTDGLLDVKKTPGERLRVSGLLEVCQRVTPAPPNPHELAVSLIREIEESSQDGFTDDVTLLAVQVT